MGIMLMPDLPASAAALLLPMWLSTRSSSRCNRRACASPQRSSLAKHRHDAGHGLRRGSGPCAEERSLVNADGVDTPLAEPVESLLLAEPVAQHAVQSDVALLAVDVVPHRPRAQRPHGLLPAPPVHTAIRQAQVAPSALTGPPTFASGHRRATNLPPHNRY